MYKSVSMAVHTIPNDVGANFVQILVLLCSLVIPAVMKRRFCDRRERMTSAWLADFWRLLATSCVSLFTLLAISYSFEGNDCVNFYTVVTIDMCLGLFMEMSILSLLRSDGYMLGYYGVLPGNFNAKVRQGTLTCLVAFACRCVSGISAIALFPLANNTLRSHDDLMWGPGWSFTAIATPCI